MASDGIGAADRGLPAIPGVTIGVEIGRGGSASVWSGTQDSLGRAVAVKLLDSNHAESFRRERAALVKLSEHPAIATVYDAGVTAEGQPYLVLHDYQGGSLSDRIAATGPLPAIDVVAIGRRMADALLAAHRAGVVHCDVTPSNVLFDSDGAAVVADFGVSRLTGDATSPVDAVTLAHAAPELLDGESGTAATDVYGLGSTLYTALEGHAPFGRERITPTVLMARIVTEPPPPLTRRDVPPTLAQLVASTMAKSPEKRPSMERVASHLATASDARARSSSRKPRLAVVVGMAVAIALGAAAAALIGTRERSAAPPTTTPSIAPVPTTTTTAATGTTTAATTTAATATTTTPVDVEPTGPAFVDNFDRGDGPLGAVGNASWASSPYRVRAGRAVVTASPAQGPSVALSGVPTSNRTMSATVSVGGTIAGSGVRVSLIPRYVDTRNQYRAQVRLRADGRATVGLYRILGSFEEVELAERFVDLKTDAPIAIAVRIEFVSSGTRLLASAWMASAEPPAEWQVVAQDDTPALAAEAKAGLGLYVAPDVGNDVTASWDDIKVE
jgi:Protein kinase domain